PREQAGFALRLRLAAVGRTPPVKRAQRLAPAPIRFFARAGASRRRSARASARSGNSRWGRWIRGIKKARGAGRAYLAILIFGTLGRRVRPSTGIMPSRQDCRRPSDAWGFQP